MKKVIFSAALTLTLSLAACSNSEDYSPQEILNQAMQETSELSSYYGEYKMTFDDGTEIVAKQWEKNGKVRVEMTDTTGEESVTINDGKTLTSYSKTTNTATIFDLGKDSEGFIPPTLKEQALNMLELIKDSHDISVDENEKIAGHDTYHLIAKAKKAGTLIGDMEIWVDRKTWMTLKTISASGDIKMTTEFTKFDPNANIDDAKFVAKLPEDAIVQKETMKQFEQLTMEKAIEKVGTFLIVPGSSGYDLDSIEDMNMTDTDEIALTYTKNGERQFSLSVFKPLEPISDKEEAIEIRGMKGSKMDLQNFRLLQWDENNLRYNIIFENPDLTFEEVLVITEQMKYVK
jgi:outer membrane lipoprotein-sorting protein